MVAVSPRKFLQPTKTIYAEELQTPPWVVLAYRQIEDLHCSQKPIKQPRTSIVTTEQLSAKVRIQFLEFTKAMGINQAQVWAVTFLNHI
jgi:hypothetical protein